MRRRTAALALASTVLGASYAAPALAANTHHQAHGQDHRPFTFAVIGDVPYGDADAEAHFPAFIAGINADPDVTQVTHLGDIKSGSTTCTTSASRPYGATSTSSRTRSSTRPATTSGPTATAPTTAATSRSSGSPRSARCSSPRPAAPRAGGARHHAGRPRHPGERPLGARRRLLRDRCTSSGSNDDLAPWTGLGKTAPDPAAGARRSTHRMAAAIANVHGGLRRGARAPPAHGRRADAAGRHVRPDGDRPAARRLLARSRRWCRRWSTSPDASAGRSTSSTATATASTRTARWRRARPGCPSTAIQRLRRRPAPGHRRRFGPRRGRLAEGDRARARPGAAQLPTGPGSVVRTPGACGPHAGIWFPAGGRRSVGFGT